MQHAIASQLEIERKKLQLVDLFEGQEREDALALMKCEVFKVSQVFSEGQKECNEIFHYGDEEGVVRIVSPENLRAEMETEIKEAAELTCLPINSVRILLNAFKWDKEKMLEQTQYGESFLQLRDIGIIVNPMQPDNSPTMSIGLMKNGGACLICKRMTNVLSMVFTACDHWFCKRCFQRYLITEIEIGDRSHFQCPFALCSMLLDDATVSKTLPPHLAESYNELCVNDFVTNSKHRRKCITDGCNRSSYYNVDIYSKCKEVKCDCGASYCFGCGNTWHYPLTCDRLKKWLNWFAKIPDYKTVANFKNDRKPCPRCSYGVMYVHCTCWENAVICPACDLRFCWCCLNMVAPPTHLCSFELYGHVQPEIMPLAKINQDYMELSQFVDTCRVSIDKSSDDTFEKYESAKPVTIDQVFEVIRKSQRLLGHSYAFSYYLENSFKKWEYLQQLDSLETEFGKLIDAFEVGNDFTVNVKRVGAGREKLLRLLYEGFKGDFWQYRKIKLVY